MRNLHRLFIGFFIVLPLAIGGGNAFGAGQFPEKPITIIVGSSAGGGADIFSRTIALGIEKEKLLPQPIVVENMPGAASGIAMKYVAGKKKDPYYLHSVQSGFISNNVLGQIPVSFADFTPIANFAFDEYMVMVRADSKYKSMKDLIADAKANPRRISVGIQAPGSGDSMIVAMIQRASGVLFNPIVFKGGGEINAALLGGHIDVASNNPGEALENLKAGKVRILAVCSEKRVSMASDIPTMKEQGVDIIFSQNRGLSAPAGIPAEARKILEQALFKYTKTQIFKKYIEDNLLSEAWMDGVTFGKYQEKEAQKYATVLKDMGLIRK